MGVKLSKNRKKSFDKKKIKAQDEVVQITRSEWEGMQESLTQVQTFMEDLVEGNLEIEIIDDEDAENEEVEVDPEAEEEVEVEGDPDVEEIEIEEEADPEAEVEEEIEGDDEKAEDEELNESIKDPIKRKAILDFLKLSATDKAEDEKEIDSADKAEDMKEEDEDKKKVGDKKIKREIKRKTLQKKAADVAIPDFTSRFRDDKDEPVKGNDDNDVNEKNASEKFRSRFE